MRNFLPEHHGLPDFVLTAPRLLPKEAELPSLTDVQFEALEAGVANGESVLVSAPTSTGKTLIGLWTIASAIASGSRAVYLVSHRALAKQKFQEVADIFLSGPLGGDSSAIVCATGDGIEDAAGRKTSVPLSARILVATYEKFLGCLSVGGPPRDLTDVFFVCDEVQLVGDKTRGQNVELLLTLLRRSGWRQMVCLSAVLSERDSVSLASWLDLTLVRNPVREKALTIKCYSPSAIHELTVSRGRDGIVERTASTAAISHPNDLVRELMKVRENRPIIAFCMKVDDTYTLSKLFASSLPVRNQFTAPTGTDLDSSLISLIQHRVAYHNAEMSEEERGVVENLVSEGKVDVVYATTTLAAGVNFPLGSAVFIAWRRWNFDKKQYEPIGRAEFQNMAGRVGRMGQAARSGLVLLRAVDELELRQALALMDLTQEESLGRGIAPSDFGSLILQLFAGKICQTRDDAFSIISETLSASREVQENRAGIEHWREHIDSEVNRLVTTGCLIESKQRVAVTSFGLAVARSGLKPETAIFFLEGLLENAPLLVDMLPSRSGSGKEGDLLFVLSHAALSSPEFNYDGGSPTRIISWRISRGPVVQNDYASRLEQLLFSRPWAGDPGSANGALLLAEWAAGKARSAVEQRVPGARLGTIQGLAREAAWILTGISEILLAVTSPVIAEESKPIQIRNEPASARVARNLARSLRRHAIQVGMGLPPDVLWMATLELAGPRKRLTRSEILRLRAGELTRPRDLMDGEAVVDGKRQAALNGPDNPNLANQVRDAARRWKSREREAARLQHERRASGSGSLDMILPLYNQTGILLESAFERAMLAISIRCEKLDLPGTQGRPDYLIHIERFPPIVFEIKSRESQLDLVGLNAATEVLAASELLELGSNFCVTLCSPGVDPSVPGQIESCKRLCVLEIADLAEAVIRVREGTLTHEELYNWLSTPGIATRDDLPVPR